MTENKMKYAPTGHFDCCGDMIRRKDKVATSDGEGHVIWACAKWWVLYQGRQVVSLNNYPMEALRKVAPACDKGCDKGCDNPVTEACDNNSLSHVLSHPLSHIKRAVVQYIKH